MTKRFPAVLSTPREQLEALLVAAHHAGWLGDPQRPLPHSVRLIRAGEHSGLLAWRIETPLALIGATWRDATAQLARIPLQAPFAASGLRAGSAAIQRKLALAKPLGEALDPSALERRLGLLPAEPEPSSPAPVPAEPPPADAPRSLLERWRTRLTSELETAPALPPPTPPEPPLWPLPVTLGGAELGAYRQAEERLQELLGWPELATDLQLAYRVRAALFELLPETRSLYLALPAAARRPAEFAETVSRLVPVVEQGDARRRWEAHQRFLRER